VSASIVGGGAAVGVEVVRRGDLTFVINHGPDAAELDGEGTDLLSGTAASGLQLPAHGVAIVRA
jgi:beta-galactosidase